MSLSLKASPVEAFVFEDSTAIVMARVTGLDAANIQQADLTSITYTIYDSAGTEIVGSTSLTVSSVVFDALQTDARWTRDDTGYNFRHSIAAGNLPSPDTKYYVEYKFTPTSGADDVFHVQALLKTKPLYRS